ncbi:hypothetical protein [Streptomyces sp. NPDC057257]|uniref:hypothetical protein n=1 Tax=Streptomyces sp. NPDC057257 TaxID=3346071 RepID=UPI0036385094
MRLGRGNTEQSKLQKTVKGLPKDVASWTPEQRSQYTQQSDRAMREQATRKSKKR